MIKNYRILSGSALKIIAIFSMVLDHTAFFVLRLIDEFTVPFFTFYSLEISWFSLFRFIGRLAYPIFAALIVEGFIHTRNRRKYGRNLFIFALISEIPWALLFGFNPFGRHNVMFTLLWGFLGLCAIERYRTDKLRQGIILVSMLLFAFIFKADMNGPGYAFIILYYTLHRHWALQVMMGSCILPMRWVAGLAFIPIYMYNGQRGFIRSPIAKYLFYAFYPTHLLVFFFLQTWLGLK